MTDRQEEYAVTHELHDYHRRNINRTNLKYQCFSDARFNIETAADQDSSIIIPSFCPDEKHRSTVTMTQCLPISDNNI